MIGRQLQKFILQFPSFQIMQSETIVSRLKMKSASYTLVIDFKPTNRFFQTITT